MHHGPGLGNSAVSVPLPSDHLNVRGSHRGNSPLNPQRSLEPSAEADGLYLPKAD